jgi:RNA polymerase sigma-70 factor (ECF subfamily)
LAIAPRPATSATSETDPSSHRRGAGAEEDAELLARWRAGDRDAGSRLVRKHHASIAGFFGNSVGDGERQDLTQQTFERITRGKDHFRGDCSVRSYFFRVARGVLVDHLRRRYRKDFDPITHSVEDVDGVTPSRVVAELGRTRKLLLCLRALPMDAKQMLELYYWQGCTAAELGAIFEVPEGTIRRRVFDAKARLRACMCGGAVRGEDEAVGLEQQIRELGELLAAGPGGV